MILDHGEAYKAIQTTVYKPSSCNVATAVGIDAILLAHAKITSIIRGNQISPVQVVATAKLLFIDKEDYLCDKKVRTKRRTKRRRSRRGRR